jgi:hypothetical protein
MKGVSLKALVRLYHQRNRPHAVREREFFRAMPSLPLAVHHALVADDRGKRFDHQRRQPRRALERAKDSILAVAGQMMRCQRFNELYELLERAIRGIRGVRGLYTYDTALRIGAFLGLAPEVIYLHRGTRVGARALSLNATAAYLTVDELPPALRSLSPELEDFLRIYKDYFAG